MALAHGLLAVFLVFGAPFAARSPRVMRWYLAMLVPTAAVNILSLPCPLTVWEKDFWRLAGETPYRGGFISHAMILWCSPWLAWSARRRLHTTDRRLVNGPLVEGLLGRPHKPEGISPDRLDRLDRLDSNPQGGNPQGRIPQGGR